MPRLLALNATATTAATITEMRGLARVNRSAKRLGRNIAGLWIA